MNKYKWKSQCEVKISESKDEAVVRIVYEVCAISSYILYIYD